MKKFIIILSIIIAVAGLVVIKLTLIDRSESPEAASAAASSQIAADVYIVSDTTVEYEVNTIGTLRAYESVDIVSELNRKVVGIEMKDGSFVRQGQLLFKLDDEDLLARFDKLETQEKLAAATEEREKTRLTKGGISRQRYDEVAASLEAVRAEIRDLKVEISKTEIKAPFSGYVGLRNTSLGAYVSPGIVLANLQDISRMKIDFSIPEKYAKDVNPGDEISFNTDYSTETFRAKVEACEPQIDLKTRSLPVRAVSDNRSNRLAAGSSAKVHLNLMEMNRSIFIPTEALMPSIKGYLVYVVRNGKAAIAPVKAGIRTAQSVQIIEGLAIGDTVVTTNLLRIKPDMPIKINK